MSTVVLLYNHEYVPILVAANVTRNLLENRSQQKSNDNKM